jgi:hypothetical protein
VTESVIERPPLAGLQIEHTEEINPRGTEIARQRAVMMDAASVSNLRAIPMFNQEVSARAINNVQAISFSRNRVSEEALMGAPFVAAAVTPTPSPTPPPAPPSEPALPADIIFIFAFICKALPKCPNPDPALQW